jgi:hypothetical protein
MRFGPVPSPEAAKARPENRPRDHIQAGGGQVRQPDGLPGQQGRRAAPQRRRRRRIQANNPQANRHAPPGSGTAAALPPKSMPKSRSWKPGTESKS